MKSRFATFILVQLFSEWMTTSNFYAYQYLLITFVYLSPAHHKTKTGVCENCGFYIQVFTRLTCHKHTRILFSLINNAINGKQHMSLGNLSHTYLCVCVFTYMHIFLNTCECNIKLHIYNQSKKIFATFSATCYLHQ